MVKDIDLAGFLKFFLQHPLCDNHPEAFLSKIVEIPQALHNPSLIIHPKKIRKGRMRRNLQVAIHRKFGREGKGMICSCHRRHEKEEEVGIEWEVLMPQLTKDPLLVQTRPLSPSKLSLPNFT